MVSDGYDASYFRRIAEKEPQSFWFRARNRVIISAIRRHFPEARSMLEVGCGTGFVLAGLHDAFPDMRLVGSELFAEGLEIARSRLPAEVELVVADAHAMPYTAEFDLAGAFDVLEHIEDDRRVIEQVAAALRPGGSFLMTVPQHPAMWSPQDVHAGHVRRYTAGGLRERLGTAGLSIVLAASFVSLLLPMMFAARLRLRSQPETPEFDAVEALRQPPLVNRVLAAAMVVERAMIRGGARFPAGGSLLVVARKPGPAAAGASR